MRALRIAMIGVKSVPAAGGISRYAEEISTRLVSRGHHVTVYCRRHFLDDPACGAHRGIERKLTPGLQGKHLDAPTHTLTAAMSGLAAGFDIVHVHGLAPGFVVPAIRALSRKRVVLTVHAQDWRGAKWGPVAGHVMEQLSSIGPRYAHQVTAVSKGLQAFLQAQRGRSAAYTPPGVNLPELAEPEELHAHGIQPDDYVLCVARLMPEKGLHYAVEAFERLNTDKSLVIAGDCPYESKYVRDLKARANDRIRFVGYATGRFLQELYSNAYLFLQPSDLEGLSIAVLEALSYGRLVLASNIPQNVEALGGNGMTFRAGEVDDLVAQLEAALQDPDRVRGEFAKGREYVAREFNWDRVTDQFEDVYESCL